jgi:hypothetical protein
MTLLGGIIGAVVGFVIGILFTEVLFASNASWPDVVPFALGVLGWLVGSALVRRRRGPAPVVRPR